MRKVSIVLSVVSLVLVALPYGFSSLTYPEGSRVDPWLQLIIGLGIWLAVLMPYFRQSMMIHGWYRQRSLSEVLMLIWSVFFFMGAVLIQLMSLNPLVWSSLIVHMYILALAYATYFILKNCVFFRVRAETRVVNSRGQILVPGEKYAVLPSGVMDYSLILRRMRLPSFEITLNCPTDKLSRRVNITPVVIIDLERLRSFKPTPNLMADFYDSAEQLIRVTLQNARRAFLDVLEMRPSAGWYNHVIPFCWEGEGSIVYETYSCHCHQPGCRHCHPEKVIDWHA